MAGQNFGQNDDVHFVNGVWAISNAIEKVDTHADIHTDILMELIRRDDPKVLVRREMDICLLLPLTSFVVTFNPAVATYG